MSAGREPAGTLAGDTRGLADVLVVGAGLSGARVCQRLRAEGFTGRVVLVGAEPDLPYDRPPLTSDPGVDTDLARTMGIDVRALADEVHVGMRAVRTERGEPGAPAWAVRLADDAGPDHVQEARVVVAASGAGPVLPAAWGPVTVLHTRRQADALWSRVGAGTELVIVGGGWIGCEVARTASALGARVALVEADDQLLPGRVPPLAADRVAALLTSMGVELRLGHAVTAVAGQARGVTVVTASGSIEGDLVLGALGVRPETGWLPERLDRAANGAALTDPWGRTTAPGLFAVGDAAARWSPRARRHLPGGHWTEAFGCAESVAPAIVSWLAAGASGQAWALAPPSPAEDPIPYTFSDLGQRRLLVLGDASSGTVVWRESGGGWTSYVLDERGLLAGVVALDRPRDVVAARKAMRAAPLGRPRVDTAALGDPDAPAARCFPAPAASDSR